MVRTKASATRKHTPDTFPSSDYDENGIPRTSRPISHSPDTDHTIPQQSARLLLRSSAAKASPHESRTNLINCINSLFSANSSKRMNLEARDNGKRDDEGEVDGDSQMETSTHGESQSATPTIIEGQESNSTPGSSRRPKTTYTREEKLEALERYHSVVEQAAALKPTNSGGKPNRTKVTIMDGARMAGVEYQTFRNWLRSEEEIRKQEPGSKNLKRARMSENLAYISTIFGTGPDEEMTDISDSTSHRTDEQDQISRVDGLYPTSKQEHRLLRQIADGSRVTKRTSVHPLSQSIAHISPSSTERQRDSLTITSPSTSSTSSSGPYTESSTRTFGNVMTSSVDKQSCVSPSARVRSSRIRMSMVKGNCEVDTCGIVCSNIGRRIGVADSSTERSTSTLGVDIQQLSHPRIGFSQSPTSSGHNSSDGSASEADHIVVPTSLSTRLVRSEVSHACIEGSVWVINCTIKNSRIVGGGIGIGGKLSSVRSSSIGITNSDTPSSTRAVAQKDCLVLSNCRIENATVVGGCGVVYDGEVLRDGVFESC